MSINKLTTPLQYNGFVRSAFANPQYIFTNDDSNEHYQTGIGGDRETGVEFKLFLDSKNQSLQYKFYGSPYALAAAEYLCSRFDAKQLSLGDDLDLEILKSKLDMPYNYFFILIALEDAWNKLI